MWLGDICQTRPGRTSEGGAGLRSPGAAATLGCQGLAKLLPPAVGGVTLIFESRGVRWPGGLGLGVGSLTTGLNPPRGRAGEWTLWGNGRGAEIPLPLRRETTQGPTAGTQQSGQFSRGAQLWSCRHGLPWCGGSGREGGRARSGGNDARGLWLSHHHAEPWLLSAKPLGCLWEQRRGTGAGCLCCSNMVEGGSWTQCPQPRLNPCGHSSSFPWAWWGQGNPAVSGEAIKPPSLPYPQKSEVPLGWQQPLVPEGWRLNAGLDGEWPGFSASLQPGELGVLG